MKLDYGSEEEFYTFLKGIKKNERVAIVTDGDNDGIVSGVLLKNLLGKEGIDVDFVKLFKYEFDLFDKFANELKKENIDVVFVTDCYYDSHEIVNSYLRLKEKFRVFGIDHHPISEGIFNLDNVIKGQGCAAYIIGELYLQCGVMSKYESDLLCSAIITDKGYLYESNLGVLKHFYPELEEKDYYIKMPGLLGMYIDWSLKYFGETFGDGREVFNLVENENIDELKKHYDEVEDEKKRQEELFIRNAEKFEEQKVWIYFFRDLKFSVASNLLTMFSDKMKDYVFIGIRERKDGSLIVNSRCQSGRVDLNKLLRKCTEGFKGASAGGHKAASGATIRKEDYFQCRENLKRELNL